MDVLNISLDEILAAVLPFLAKLGMAILFYVVARVLAAWTSRAIRTAMERRRVDNEVILLVQMISRWAILIVGILLALEQIAPGRFGGLIAGLGIAGFTLGFALQDVAKNFISGILLLIQQPFNIGDAIEVVGFSGTVQDITLRTTEIRTWDGRNVLIPNGDVYVKPIVNFSREPYRRLEMKLSVKQDLELASLSSSILSALRRVAGVLEQPAPEAVWTTSGAASTELTAYYWLNREQVDLRSAQNQALDLVQAALKKAAPGVSHSVSASAIEGT